MLQTAQLFNILINCTAFVTNEVEYLPLHVTELETLRIYFYLLLDDCRLVHVIKM